MTDIQHYILCYENGQLVRRMLMEDGDEWIVGGGIDAIVHFKDSYISKYHAVLKCVDGLVYVQDLNSQFGTYVNYDQVDSSVLILLRTRDKLSFGQGDEINLVYESVSKIKKHHNLYEETLDNNLFENGSIITIGSSSDCDIVIYDKYVSQKHATLEYLGGNAYEVCDLHSKTGIYYKGQKVRQAYITSGETFIIGRSQVDVFGNWKRLDEETAVRVENVTKIFKRNVVGMHQTSFEIKPKTLTAIMGPSGCGKSTLLKMMSGVLPISSGSISLFDLDVNKHFDFIKEQIGYVPQDDIVHLELTVYESLYFAAKIRLAYLSEEEIKRKILYLLAVLKIEKIRNNLNSAISGGQRKRVCIALELLTDPTILFLDEPTSPLDPQSIEEFLTILKDLANNQTTVVMVTHKPEDLQFMDEVVFLAEGGHLIYKGGVAEYKTFFGVTSAVEVYTELSGERSEKWIGKYASQELSENQGDVSQFDSKKVKVISQFLWLTVRNIRIKTNDRLNTAILIFQAPIIAFLIAIIFDAFSLGVLFMMCVSAVWFGVNNASREIVKEQAIYARERMLNLRIGTYLFSKLVTLLLIAVVQSVLFVCIISLFYEGHDVRLENGVFIFSWLLLLSVLSSLFGLLISAIMKNTEKVMAVVPIALIPQIMLAGVLTRVGNPLIEFLSYFTISRWGVEGLANIQRHIAVDTPKFLSNDKGMPIKGEDGEFQYVYELTKEDAVKPLVDNFHEVYGKVFGSMSSQFSLDLIMILFLSSGVLVSLFIIMRKKKIE